MAQYKLRCNTCDHIYYAPQRYYNCDRINCRSSHTTFIEEVLEVASDVAAAYFMVDAVGDVMEGLGGFLGSVFD